MTKRQQVLFVLILAVAASLRMINIDHVPYLIFDEAHYVPAAQVVGKMRENPNPEIWKSVPVIRDSPDPNFVHPPGAKILMLAGMKLFGNRPIGWRIFSWCFGVGSILLVFFFAKKVFDSYDDALIAMMLISFDCLHLLQSRIAMLDVFLLFFVTAFFFVVYIAEPGRDRKWIWLGLLIALGTSIKYVFALWAFAGLLLILLTKGIRKKTSWHYVLLAGSLSLAVYSLWAFFFMSPDHGFVDWMQLHVESVRRTTSPLAIHRYGSHPAQWLFNSKAILYAFTQGSGSVQALVGIGNPVLWLAFIPASYWAVHRWLQTRKMEDLYFLLFFLIIYLPLYLLMWKRQGYLYYMLPAVVPMVFLVCQLLRAIHSKLIKVVFVVSFLLATTFFLPALTYEPMPRAWYQAIAALVDL